MNITPGLRITGADGGECPPQYPDQCVEDNGNNCRDCVDASIGILIKGYDRIEVDNNELAGWSHSAVQLKYSVDNRVHHNHIHHTQRQGLGYGVTLSRWSTDGDKNVTVTIEHNRFNFFRVAIQ